MTNQEWLVFGGLCVALLGAILGLFYRQTDNRNQILNRIEKNKEELNDELSAIRIAAYEEYKILRREMSEAHGLAYREFGETILAIREKVTQVELWIRDELKDTRHTLQGSMDMRNNMMGERLEKVDDRVRQLEIGSSHKS